jgi:hypothetical protein
MNSAIAVFVDFPLQKPCCLLLIILWLFRNDESLLCMIFSIIFEKTEISETGL